MQKVFSFGFWNFIASRILRNRIPIILILIGITVFLGFQWKNMQFSFTEANLLPDDAPINKQYADFEEKFGSDGNVIMLATDDEDLFTPKNFKAWQKLADTLSTFPEIKSVIGIHNLQKLEKREDPKRFEMQPILESDAISEKQIEAYGENLFTDYPFYDGLIFNSETKTVQTVAYMQDSIVNAKGRKIFVMEKFVPLIESFKDENSIEIHVSGMPYIRTLNSQNIVDEIQWFVLSALLVTSFIFFFFFRSFRATLISMLTVIIGVMWAFGFIGLLGFEITVLTAVIPPLIIIIGIPNCIFLINKYQHEIKQHGNQAKSLQRVITKIGNATLMTNVTTASGFATFIFTQSELLKEFGILASINIIAIFILSLLIIPIIYSYLPRPQDKHLRHLGKQWIEGFVEWIVKMVKHRRVTIYFTSVAVLGLSIIGIFNIKISGSLLEDMPQSADFFQDIKFFEDKFDGVLPLEIMIDTKRQNGVTKLSTLKKMDELKSEINEIEELSPPLSVVNLAKYAKQAFYNNNPKYYQLPTSQEQTFMSPYIKSMDNMENGISSYVDSTGQFARMTMFMKDVTTEEISRIEAKLLPEIDKIFPKERFEVTMTGKALVYQKGTHYLVDNLILSLSLAIILIALFMAWMFRSFRMILISLIPNLLPLLMTAGMMGFIGVPIKPSTILVFSIAFGISVDDTIHFLAKYRQELKANHWKIKRSVYPALRETTVSMFYTSIVLFFGFSVFMISSFGGTVALGGLVSATLLFAMLANLLLLPSLLLSLERSIANHKTMKEPQIKIIDTDDDENEKS
ncbi:efflux RND transporter permease subunit [Psychroflexus montanilacus]|uniref:efflux RND transporter permease subunit n=1 Tax=Psychroflexus montanilacus TaxID=2873598 RepID=UPI001CCA6F72|nr:efflux RND transporter permease subunit [Psychroflexus montanilacus]MBZ9652422.1 MMPL family transporter [Psychroflexus montanilacus]